MLNRAAIISRLSSNSPIQNCQPAPFRQQCQSISKHSAEKTIPVNEKKKYNLSRKPKRIFNKLELENFQPEKK